MSICGTDDIEPWNGPQAGKLFNGLMGGAILAQGNGIMRPHVNGGHLHQRGQTHSWPHVVTENEECPAKRPGGTMEGYTVQDRPHGVFADTKVQHATVGGGRPI